MLIGAQGKGSGKCGDFQFGCSLDESSLRFGVAAKAESLIGVMLESQEAHLDFVKAALFFPASSLHGIGKNS